MNKKLKCLLSAALVLIMLVSAAVIAPATAAQNPDETGSETATEGPAPAELSQNTEENINSGDVFTDGRIDLKEMSDTDASEQSDAAPDAGAPEIADTGAGEGEGEGEGGSEEDPKEVDLDGELNPYRESRYTNRIVLKWTALKGVDGYRVYWRDLTKENAQLKLLSTVSTRSVTVSNLKAGSKFNFVIRPYINDGGEVKEGKGAKLVAATVPAPVRNFRLKSGGSAGTVMRWTRTVGIDGYLLLRQYQGVWQEYKYLSASATEFKDTNVNYGHAYYYKIMTYRKDTRGYLKSSTSLLRTVCGLCAPADTGSSSRVNRVYLSWRDIRCATGYQVFYSTDNVTYKGLAITEDNYFTTKKFKEGTKVYFRIRPYRLVGTSKTQVLGTYSQFSVKVLANSFGAEVGDTYVEIDISDQHMWYVVDNDVYVSTPVVTGNYDSMDTPTGIFSVQSMARDVSLVGAGYVSFVEYWIAFIGSSYGIHDASWRSRFGGSIYKGDGSHGCVNTPYDAVRKIYNHIDVGTPVVIHN